MKNIKEATIWRKKSFSIKIEYVVLIISNSQFILAINQLNLSLHFKKEKLTNSICDKACPHHYYCMSTVCLEHSFQCAESAPPPIFICENNRKSIKLCSVEKKNLIGSFKNKAIFHVILEIDKIVLSDKFVKNAHNNNNKKKKNQHSA